MFPTAMKKLDFSLPGKIDLDLKKLNIFGKGNQKAVEDDADFEDETDAKSKKLNFGFSFQNVELKKFFSGGDVQQPAPQDGVREEGQQPANKMKSFISDVATTVKGKYENAKNDFLAEKPKTEPLVYTGQPPWAPTSELEIGFESVLRTRILELSKDRNTFLQGPPAEEEDAYPFDFQTILPTAMAALKVDNYLQRMRFILVPRKISEEKFWRNYFYHVTKVKTQFLEMRANMKKKDASASDGDDVSSVAQIDGAAGISQSSGHLPSPIADYFSATRTTDPLGSGLASNQSNTSGKESPSPASRTSAGASSSSASSIAAVPAETEEPSPVAIPPGSPASSSDPLQAVPPADVEEEFAKFLMEQGGTGPETPTTEAMLVDELFSNQLKESS